MTKNQFFLFFAGTLPAKILCLSYKLVLFKKILFFDHLFNQLFLSKYRLGDF